MKTSEFDFNLPEELIAQTPLTDRTSSRLCVVNRKDRTIKDAHFDHIIDYLKPGDVLVRNNTKVIPARLYGFKPETGAHVEVLLLKDLGDNVWECLVGNSKVVKIDTQLTFGEGLLNATCVARLDEGIRHLKFNYDGVFFEILDKIGNMPLPPYIHEKLEDPNRYQTVYAQKEGSAAAPTAGLHFTQELFAKLKDKGVEIVDVTLNVGLGTFRPMKTDTIEQHVMHSEAYQMSQDAADILNKAKKEGRRIIAIGTTSVRVLETVYANNGCFKETNDSTQIFIYPGYQWQAVDALITNFHLPKSTLFMLVCSFASKELMLKAYNHCIDEKYRFFSFGDAMFIC